MTNSIQIARGYRAYEEAVLSHALAVIVIIAIGWVAASLWRKGKRGSGAWTPFEWFRLTFSAAAFFVPMAMTGVAIAIIESFAHNVAGQNPWVTQTDNDRTLAAISCLVVAIGVAGQIGLLQAWRRGENPGPDDFVRGIRQHTLTFVLVKLAWAGTVSNMDLPYSRYFDVGARHRGDIADYAAVLIPSVFAAGVIAAAGACPNRPFKALLGGITAPLRHPIATGIPLAVQASIMLLTIQLAHSYTGMTFVLANASPIGFQLFPYGLIYMPDDPTVFIALINGLTAPVLITAFWSVTAGAPDGAALKPTARQIPAHSVP